MLDFAFIWQHIGLFKSGLLLTIAISACGIALAVVIGLVCACVLIERELANSGKLKRALLQATRLSITSYVEVARNTPLLIQLFFLYFALPKVGITLSAFTCATTALAFLGGGYMCESFRAGLGSISKTQVESALSIGLSRLNMLRFVVLPQGLGVALPGITANVIFLIKETSVVGILALGDILYISKDIIDLYGKTYEALAMLLLMYVVLLLPISLAASALESHLNKRL